MDDVALSDSSSPSKTVVKNGDVNRSSAQSKFGGYSAYFDGSGDYLSTPDSDDWKFGTGDFTIDFWINTGTESKGKYIWHSGGLSIYVHNPSGAIIATYTGGNLLILGTTNIVNVWHHVAFIRNSGTFKLYIDGNLDGTETAERNLDSSVDPIYIGAYSGGGNYYFNGYLEEFRVSKGVARWTGNFTPPTQPY
jgi:hypothetical protein